MPQDKDAARLVDSLNLSAFELRNTFPDSSVSLAVRALGLAENHNYLKGQAIALNIQGIYHKNKGRLPIARKFYDQSLAIRKEIGDPNLLAEQYINLGNFFKQTGEMDSALIFLKRALTIQDSLGNLDKSANALADIGLVLKAQGEYAQSLLYFDKGLTLQRNLGNQADIARALIRKGEVYELLNHGLEARKCYVEAIGILSKVEPGKHLASGYNNLGNVLLHAGHLDSAETCYLQSKRIREEKGFSGDLAGTFLNLGMVSRLRGHIDAAMDHTLKAMDLFKKFDDPVGQAEANHLMGELLMDASQPQEAKVYFEACLRMVGGDLSPALYLKVLQSLAHAASLTSDYASAYRYSNEHGLFLDTLNQRIRKAEDLISKQEVEIATLKNESKMMQLESENAIFKGISFSIAALFLAIGTIIFWRLREKKRSEQQRQQTEIDQMMDQHRHQLLMGMAKSQAEERKKVADELHGHLGGLLAAAKLKLESLEDHYAGKTTEEAAVYQSALSLIISACEETRNIAHGKSDELVLRYGYLRVLEDLVQKINTGGKIHLQFKTSLGGVHFEEGFEIEIFRLTQDLLTNILKHSKAKSATIQFLQNKDKLMIMFEDNGVGFNLDDLANKTGMGLNATKSRVEILGGSMTIDSAPQSGCTVIVELPVRYSFENHQS